MSAEIDRAGSGGVVELPARFIDGIAILVTRVFCPNGHNLVRNRNVLFGGHPGISIMLEASGWKGEVILSPFQGDPGKYGMNEAVKPGTICHLSCPECGVALPEFSDCGCSGDGKLVGFFLRPNLSEGDMVMVCNRLGCRRSVVMDGWQALSEYPDSTCATK